MYRPGMIMYQIVDGFKSIDNSLKAIFWDADKDDFNRANYNIESKLHSIIWVSSSFNDLLCQNSLFWQALVDGSIVNVITDGIKNNFNIKVEYLFIGDEVITEYLDRIRNDNAAECFTITDSHDLEGGFGEFITDADFQKDYVMNIESIDEIEDIKEWIRERGLDSDFDLRKSDETLKEGIKEYYNLTNNIDEI